MVEGSLICIPADTTRGKGRGGGQAGGRAGWWAGKQASRTAGRPTGGLHISQATHKRGCRCASCTRRRCRRGINPAPLEVACPPLGQPLRRPATRSLTCASASPTCPPCPGGARNSTYLRKLSSRQAVQFSRPFDALRIKDEIIARRAAACRQRRRARSKLHPGRAQVLQSSLL